MNLTKTLPTLFICLLPLSVSAGELDGKSLICIKQHTSWLTTGVKGFHFNEPGYVTGEELVIADDTVKVSALKTDTPVNYYRYPTEIVWWEVYSLDRKQLVLAETVTYESRVTGEDSYYLRKYKCEVFETRESYTETFSTYQQEWLEKLQERMKDNKIYPVMNPTKTLLTLLVCLLPLSVTAGKL